jgi:hypothetical protein
MTISDSTTEILNVQPLGGQVAVISITCSTRRLTIMITSLPSLSTVSSMRESEPKHQVRDMCKDRSGLATYVAA